MKKHIKLAIVALALSSFANVASAEKSGEEQMREFQLKQMIADNATFQLPAQPIPGKALVFVERTSNLGGAARFEVFVDGKDTANEIGSTYAGKYIYFYVSPGAHQVFSKAGNWSGVDLNVKDGDIVYLEQEAHFGLFQANNSISLLDGVKGKHQLRTLGKGEMLNDHPPAVTEANTPPEAPQSQKLSSPAVASEQPAQHTTTSEKVKTAAAPSTSEVGTKLKELQDIWKAGLITDQEYAAKKEELLKKL